MNLNSREMRKSLRRLNSLAKRMTLSALDALSRELDTSPFVKMRVIESKGTEDMKSTMNHPRRYRLATVLTSRITCMDDIAEIVCIDTLNVWSKKKNYFAAIHLL